MLSLCLQVQKEINHLPPHHYSPAFAILFEKHRAKKDDLQTWDERLECYVYYDVDNVLARHALPAIIILCCVEPRNR